MKWTAFLPVSMIILMAAFAGCASPRSRYVLPADHREPDGSVASSIADHRVAAEAHRDEARTQREYAMLYRNSANQCPGIHRIGRKKHKAHSACVRQNTAEYDRAQALALEQAGMAEAHDRDARLPGDRSDE